MSLQQVKLPGPEHPIAITRNAKRVVVMVDGRVIADVAPGGQLPLRLLSAAFRCRHDIFAAK